MYRVNQTSRQRNPSWILTDPTKDRWRPNESDRWLLHPASSRKLSASFSFAPVFSAQMPYSDIRYALESPHYMSLRFRTLTAEIRIALRWPGKPFRVAQEFTWISKIVRFAELPVDRFASCAIFKLWESQMVLKREEPSRNGFSVVRARPISGYVPTEQELQQFLRCQADVEFWLRLKSRFYKLGKSFQEFIRYRFGNPLPSFARMANLLRDNAITFSDANVCSKYSSMVSSWLEESADENAPRYIPRSHFRLSEITPSQVRVLEVILSEGWSSLSALACPKLNG